MALFWSLVFVDPLIILSTFICGVISLIASPFDPTGEFMMKTARVWARSLLVIAGVKVKVEGLEKLVPGSSYVFASNHLSYMDTPVILTHIPADFRFMATRGLLKAPRSGRNPAKAGIKPS